MRIGIIGQPTIDEIVHPGMRVAKPERVLGGILYSYAAMERLMREFGRDGDTFVPMTWHSNPDREFLETLLIKFRQMDRAAGLWPTDSLSNRVQLVYQEDGHRSEHCPHILPPITVAELSALLLESLDGLFINMISGFDVSLETLESAVRKLKNRPWIHLDIHALVLGPLSQASSNEKFGSGREPQGVSRWKRWMALADSVQMNEFETRWLADPEITAEGDLLNAIGRMSSEVRPKQVIITRAANGASVYDLEHGEAHHAPVPIVDVIETTGSGDVFGSAYSYCVIAGNAPEAALRKAVQWATWNTTVTSINQILDRVFKIKP